MTFGKFLLCVALGLQGFVHGTGQNTQELDKALEDAFGKMNNGQNPQDMDKAIEDAFGEMNNVMQGLQAEAHCLGKSESACEDADKCIIAELTDKGKKNADYSALTTSDVDAAFCMGKTMFEAGKKEGIYQEAETKLKTWVIIVLVVVGVLLVAGVIFCCYRRRQKRNNAPTNPPTMEKV